MHNFEVNIKLLFILNNLEDWLVVGKCVLKNM
jgi:hypothetical protein